RTRRGTGLRNRARPGRAGPRWPRPRPAPRCTPAGRYAPPLSPARRRSAGTPPAARPGPRRTAAPTRRLLALRRRPPRFPILRIIYRTGPGRHRTPAFRLIHGITRDVPTPGGIVAESWSLGHA